ncbi:MAG TPA: hypothetical protein VIW01_02590 [Dehalococcoidia bacterium]
MSLHVGGASTAAVLVTVVAIFFLILAMSFAIGAVPEGQRRFSGEWCAAWFRASLPRIFAAGAFSTLLFVGSSLSGSSDTTDAQICDLPLAPLTGQSITSLRLNAAVTGMQEIASAAREGDASAAQSLFYTSDAHNVSHDVAGPLFSADQDLARTLCESVVSLENEIAGELRPEVIAAHAGSTASALQVASAALNLGDDAKPIPGASGPCALPVGAIGVLPLTDERLVAAVAAFRETAATARAGDVIEASEAFAGDAHNITHDIDGPLRNADAALAVDLCESVSEIERQFATAADTTVIADEAEASAVLLEEAGRLLGITE